MSIIEEKVQVQVPLRTAYDQWTQFELFPEFMSGVDRVEQLSDTLTRWTVSIAGVEREFDAEILHQVPDERISWVVKNGPKHQGTVSFTSTGNETEVTTRIDYTPEGALEHAGDALGLVSNRVKGDLQRFKEFIENRNQETGAWRGEVKPGDGQTH